MSVLSRLKKAVVRLVPEGLRGKGEASSDESFVILLASSRVQIADDLTDLYRNSPIKLMIVDNAKDLLFAVAEKKINLIVLDLDVRRLADHELLSVVKKIRPRLGVVVLSDDVSFETRRSLVQDGALYQIQMPVESRQIHQMIESIINKMRRKDQ